MGNLIEPVKGAPPQWALVISYNYLTGETLHQRFEGARAADDAEGWAHFWKAFGKFPERGERIATELLEQGQITTWVPTGKKGGATS